MEAERGGRDRVRTAVAGRLRRRPEVPRAPSPALGGGGRRDRMPSSIQSTAPDASADNLTGGRAGLSPAAGHEGDCRTALPVDTRSVHSWHRLAAASRASSRSAIGAGGAGASHVSPLTLPSRAAVRVVALLPQIHAHQPTRSFRREGRDAQQRDKQLPRGKFANNISPREPTSARW